jgi:DNA-binding transcriptional ArsR family regulator
VLNSSEPLDRVFQALADPTRRDIVERLTQAPASVSELASPLAMSLPAVMQHLQVLETSGLVVSEKVGRVRTCRIDPAAIRTAEAWIHQQRLLWERRLDSLGLYLSPNHAQPTASKGAEQSAGRDLGPRSQHRSPKEKS